MRVCFILTAAIVFFCGALASGQTPSDPARDLARQASDRIRQLQAEADTLAAQTNSLLNELRGLELQRQIKTEEVAKANALLAQLSADVDATTKRVTTLEARRLADTPWVKERVVALYKRRHGGYLRLLLAAGDLQSLGRMSRGVASVARLDRVRLDSHRRTVREERAALAELQDRRAEVDKARGAATKARQALDQAVSAHNRRLDDLDRRRDLAARYIGELQGAQTELQKAVGTLGATATALPLAPFRGSLDWPATGRLLSRFGRSTGRFGTAIARNGIEIGVAEGTPVRAVHGGTVAYAAPFTGFGTLVIVDHGRGAFTLYGHLTETRVGTNAKVARGDIVGRAGRTPDGDAAAYFELRIDGRPVDPVQWLRSTR